MLRITDICKPPALLCATQWGLTAINEPGKLSFILAASECHYKQKLFYPGKIRVDSLVTQINNTSFHIEHIIYNENNEVVSKGKDAIVAYDYQENCKVKIQGDLFDRLTAIS